MQPLRRPFYRDSKLLTGLCRSAVEATHAYCRAGLGRGDLKTLHVTQNFPPATVVP